MDKNEKPLTVKLHCDGYYFDCYNRGAVDNVYIQRGVATQVCTSNGLYDGKLCKHCIELNKRRHAPTKHGRVVRYQYDN